MANKKQWRGDDVKSILSPVAPDGMKMFNSATATGQFIKMALVEWSNISNVLDRNASCKEGMIFKE